MRKLPLNCEEIISVYNKVTNVKTNGLGYLGKVILAIYHDFGYLGDIYSQNSKINW